MRPPPTSGLVALPLPRGDPSGLWAAAAALRAAAERAPAREASGVVEGAWSGAAAEEASTELAALAGRAGSWADRVRRAAAVLGAYADELDGAQRAVALLQSDWDDAVPADPLDASAAAAATPHLARLSGSYAAAVADLELAEAVAAHRLRELVAEVVAPDRPGRPGSALGWSDPVPGAAAVRAAVLGDLPLVVGAGRRVEAGRVADEVAGDLAAAASGDAFAVDRAAGRLAGPARDPLVAQALWSRLDPPATARLLDALTEPDGVADAAWVARRRAALLGALGAALATAANPAYARDLDPESRARLDVWRGGWLTGLVAAVAASAPRPDGGRVGGGWVQGQLLAGARGAGLSPGPEYAATVGVALVEADRRGADARDIGADGSVRAVPGGGDDVVLALAQALGSDLDAARTWLLAPLSDSATVLHQLVRGRYDGHDAAAAAASMAAVSGLVVTAGSDVRDRRSVQVASVFVDAVGAESVATTHPDVWRRALAPSLADLGTVLARHPSALADVLDDSSGLGTDAVALPAADRLVRPGAAPGTWTVVLAERRTAAAAVGQLAFDRAPEPALALLTTSLGAQLDADLVAAVRSEHTGDPHAVDAVAFRWGQTVGFTLSSAGEALAGRDADTDARNRALGTVVEAAVGKVAVPGLVGRLATPLIHLAGDRLVTAALPTDAEAAQRQATATTVGVAREAAYVELRSAVSRAQPWTEAQAPARWAQSSSGGVTRFWDDRGVPLPEGAMTTSQRQAFTDWRRAEGLSAYDTVPQRVRDGIDDGVETATRDPATVARLSGSPR